MKSLFLRLTFPAAMIGSLAVQSQPLPTTPTTTRPAIPLGTPATQPLPPAVTASVTVGPSKMLLLPFTGIDTTDRRDWISRGVLSSLQADLSRLISVQPITLDATKPENAPPEPGYDTEMVLKLARSVGARYAIFGTYQTIDPELRLVGVILDVPSGQPVGGMKATGTLRDIFGMEDSIGTQAKRHLQQAAVAVQAPPPSAPVTPPPGPTQNTNETGPVRNPFPAVVFDDDVARQSIDRLRYRDDWDFPYSPYPSTYFGFGPMFGFGWGTRSYYRSPRSSATPVPSPVHPSPAVTHEVFGGQIGNGNSIFRGGGYLDAPPRVVPTRMAGTTTSASVSAGYYSWPAPLGTSVVPSGSQTGGFVRSAAQLGTRNTPAAPPVQSAGARPPLPMTEGLHSGR